VITYAVMDSTGTTIINIVKAPTDYIPDPTWIVLISDANTTNNGVWVDWTTPDGGATWIAP